jgi:hypothetical protein
MKSIDIPFYTNHLSLNDGNYYNQSLYNYWISSSHNTYLPYGQVFDPSNTCYYNLVLHLFFGGCVEIDTDSVTNDDVIVTHLPTNTRSIKLSEILKIVIKVLQQKISKGITSGPIILTFDNKQLTKKSEHSVFWKVLEKYLLNEENYKLVAVLTDDFDLTQIPISELSNQILLRWGENNSLACNNITSDKIEVGKDICPIDDDRGINNFYSYIKTKKHWMHLLKGHVDFRNEIKKVENKTVSLSVPIYIKKTPPNYNFIINTQRNLVRVYPHFSYTMSQNYDNMIFFRDGFQITALNLQHLSDAWYLNSAVFLPAYGVACSPEETSKSEANPCYNGWDSMKVNTAEPLAYRLKPLWLLGLLPYPNLYDLKIRILKLYKIENKIRSSIDVSGEYPICNIMYGLTKTVGKAKKTGEYIELKNIDPTVPFFVIDIIKGGMFNKFSSTYKGGLEIKWNYSSLKGDIVLTAHKIRKTISGMFNKVELSNNCDTSYFFNSRKQIEIELEYTWTKSDEIPEMDKYNKSVNSLRESNEYKDVSVSGFLSNLTLFNTYQTDLRNLLLFKPLVVPGVSDGFVDEDSEARHYSKEIEPLTLNGHSIDTNDVTDD